jgi:tetratricopeptide (TPR) repeat protein
VSGTIRRRNHEEQIFQSLNYTCADDHRWPVAGRSGAGAGFLGDSQSDAGHALRSRDGHRAGWAHLRDWRQLFRADLNVFAASWQTITPLPTARYVLAAVAHPDGLIYAIGGADAGSTLNAVEAFDPQTGAWTAMSGLNTGRYNPAAALGQNGRIYVFGGHNGDVLDTVEEYDAAGDKREEAETLYCLGYNHQFQFELQTAFEYYDQAREIYRALNERGDQAGMLRILGKLAKDLGNAPKAMELYGQCLALYRAAGDRSGEVGALINIGDFYVDLGEYRKALETASQTLAIARDVGYRNAQYRALSTLSNAHFFLGELQSALEANQQALPIARAAGDQKLIAVLLNNTGFLCQHLGDAPQALDYYLQALPYYRRINDLVGESAALNNIGNIYHLQGDAQKALEYLNQALAGAETAQAREYEATFLGSIGRVHQDLGDLPKAAECFTRAVALSRAISDRTGESTALLGLGLVTRETGKSSQALEYFTQALSLAQAIGYRLLEAKILKSIAQSERDQGNTAAAREKIEQAISLLELMRSGVGARDIQASFFATVTDSYDFHTDLLMRMQAADPRAGHDQEALKVSEQSRARSLLESLAEARADIREGVDSALLQKARALQQQLNAKAAAQTRLLNGKHTEAQAAAIAGEIRNLTAELNQIETQIRQTSPRYATLTQPRPLTVAPGILSYLPFAALPKPEVGIKRASDSSAESLPNSEFRIPNSNFLPLIAEHEIVSAPSASVVSVLRRENKDRQAATKSVAVLADPVFETNDPRLALAMKKNSGNPPTADRPETLAMNAELRRAVRGVNPMRAGFARLPFSAEEAEAILSVTPSGAGLKATGFRANRTTATSADLSQYRIVHFATHGLLNSAQPELSGLVFSLVDESGKPQDGFLRLHEIFNLKLNADLVVLSACQTGLGKEIRGEGLVGLTRGFMYAGAPRVVASLWQVDDLATAELMKRFYRGMLKENLRPAAALRAAQLELSQQKRWAAPYFWAAFTLQGEWR